MRQNTIFGRPSGSKCGKIMYISITIIQFRYMRFVPLLPFWFLFLCSYLLALLMGIMNLCSLHDLLPITSTTSEYFFSNLLECNLSFSLQSLYNYVSINFSPFCNSKMAGLTTGFYYCFLFFFCLLREWEHKRIEFPFSYWSSFKNML